MIKKSIFFAILFLLTFTNGLFAQHLEWSNTQKLRGNSLYTSVIGEDESGIYILRHRNKFMSKFIVLERYRHNLGLEISKSFMLKNTRILYSDMNEYGILIIKQEFDKKANHYKIIGTLLNNSFETIMPETVITIAKLPISEVESKIVIEPSPNHSHYLILNYGYTNSNKNFNKYTIISPKLNTLDSGSFQFNPTWNVNSIESVITENGFDFTLLLNLKANKNERKKFAIYDQNIFKIISDSNYHLDKVKLFYNAKNNEKGVTGFYTSSMESGYEGDFFIKWQLLDFDSLNIKKNSFSRTILKELSGEHKSMNGFLSYNYKPLKIISRDDGGFIKISENSFSISDQDLMVVNGVPASQGKNIYSYENVLIQNYDSIGRLNWETSITKNQNTINDGGLLSSIATSVSEYAFYILYNDPISSGGDIVQVKLLPDGQKKTQILVKGDEMNAFIIPLEGKQISGDKMIVPVLKDRKFALLKITFKQ